MDEKSIIDLETFFKDYIVSKKKVEDNFFTIGTRGFYENPFTEILSYVLDSETQYSYRQKFITNILGDIVGTGDLEGLIQFAKTSTQYPTLKGNVIDIVLYNDKCIVVFENKIFHDANNPFEDYVAYITNKHKGKEIYFILFSYKKQIVIVEGWKYINIQENFDRLLVDYPSEFLNKWDYLVYDFIKHFSTKKNNMTDSEINLYKTNFHKIINVSNGLTEFIKNISTAFVKDNGLTNFSITNWNGETKAVRFYPDNTKSNVVLIFNTNGTFSVSVYYYREYSFVDEIHVLVGIDKYREWGEGKGSVCCFTLDKTHLNTLEHALEECKEQVGKMKSFTLS